MKPNVNLASTRGQAVPTPETDYSKSADERYGPINCVSDTPETDALFVKMTQALVTAKTVEDLLAFARRLEAANVELVNALQELVDHQNGCPLPKYEAGWNKAMDMARTALARIAK